MLFLSGCMFVFVSLQEGAFYAVLHFIKTKVRLGASRFVRLPYASHLESYYLAVGGKNPMVVNVFSL